MIDNYLAQVPLNIGRPLCGLGPLGLCNDQSETKGISQLARFLSTAIGLLTIIAALYFLFVLIIGSIEIISSGGDKNALEEARKKITSGAIGLVITISAIFIFGIVATLLGIPYILDIGQMINLIIIGP